MSNRALHLGLLVMLCATAVAVAWCPPADRTVARNRQQATLALVPSGTEIVVTANIPRLRATSLGRLVTAQGRQLPEVGTLERICGFDPTERIREIIVAVPSTATEQNDFGITVVGDFEANRLAGCAGSVVKHRGGQPAATPIGSFTAVRDRRDSGGGEVAVRDGGPAILADGSYLRDLIDVVEGRGRSALDDGLHGTLRRVVDPAKDGAIVATWVPGPGRFEALGIRAAGSWSAVRGLALRVSVSPDLNVSIVLACSPAAGCDRIAGAVRQLRSTLARPAQVRLGLDLDRVTITRQADHISLSLQLSPSEAQAFIERALQAGPALGAPR